MSKIWTILKAIWLVIWTNRELIEKHLLWIQQEKESDQNKDTTTTTKKD